MRINLAVLISLSALTTQALAQTTPPVWTTPPQVTVGANLKELVFDWEPVPGAVLYRILLKTTANPREYYAPIGERLRQTRAAVPISVYQQLWETTRYIVQACNPAGCTRSAEVFPRDLMLDTIGYFKASNTEANDGFGRQVAASADGSTIAVSASGESSNATGVNGNQTNNSAPNSGAVYVYRRNGRNWAQEAYLKPPDVQAGGRFGAGSPYRLRTLELSANGSRLLVGAPASAVSGLANAGRAYLFQRDSANNWSIGLELRAPVSAANDYFGYSVDLASDGNMLKVNSLLPIHSTGEAEGRTHLWIHNGSTWTYQLAPQYGGDLCRSTRLSADGRTLVSYCLSTTEGGARVTTMRRQADNTWRFEPDIRVDWVAGAPRMAITYSASWLAVTEGQYIRMYRWDGPRWVLDVSILPWTVSDGPGEGGWGEALEFSRHGEFLAIGDPSARIFGAGVSDPMIGSERDGAVVIYKHRPDSIPQWYSFKTVKAPNPSADDAFGTSVAFGGTGWYLAIAAPQEDSAARGVDGDQTSETATDSGAVYLY
ncbi:MAG TPA: hypothetical protein VFS58_13810 [Steroidobacteraceae bacterium]|nr:hypothetical protein [Steroidobacteraceae bacterium]